MSITPKNILLAACFVIEILTSPLVAKATLPPPPRNKPTEQIQYDEFRIFKLYGIRVGLGRGCDVSSQEWCPSQDEYMRFLKDFIYQAKKSHLETVEFFSGIKLLVNKENWFGCGLFSGNLISCLRSDLSIVGAYNYVYAGHRSGSDAVDYLMDRFPKKNSEESIKELSRNDIMTYLVEHLLQEFLDRGYLVYSQYYFSNGTYESSESIEYLSAKYLLASLVAAKAKLAADRTPDPADVGITAVINLDADDVLAPEANYEKWSNDIDKLINIIIESSSI